MRATAIKLKAYKPQQKQFRNSISKGSKSFFLKISK